MQARLASLAQILQLDHTVLIGHTLRKQTLHDLDAQATALNVYSSGETQ